MTHPKADLFRMLTPLTELRMAGDGRSFTGYAAVFNSPTVINSWEGHFVEQFRNGAFTKTLTENGSKVKMLFNHGFDPTRGELPIASIEQLVEDDHGLLVRARMLDSAADYTEAVTAGALDGMSFRFTAVKDNWNDRSEPPTRTVTEAKLHEVSLVTFPAYAATTAGVRGAAAYAAWRKAEHENPEAADTGTSPDEAADSGTSWTDRVTRAVWLEKNLRKA